MEAWAVGFDTFAYERPRACFVFANPSDADIKQRLESIKTIAVVGLSGDSRKDSYGVAEYLVSAGYSVVPVNPGLQIWEGRQAFPSLESAKKAADNVGRTIDLVDVFRRSSAVPALVAEVMRLKLPGLWCQLDVIDWDEAARARDHGVWTVMDRCLAVEHRRLLGSPEGH